MVPNNRFGFTLVEMLVVTGIMLLTTGFGVARYNDYTQQRRLNQEAKEFTSVMELASKRAVSGDSTTACADFQGIQVSMAPSGTYTMRRCCEGACNSAQSTVYNTYPLPTGITLSAPTATTTYLFNKLTQTITVNPAANQTVTFRNTVSSRCLSVTVSPAGLINLGTEIAC